MKSAQDANLSRAFFLGAWNSLAKRETAQTHRTSPPPLINSVVNIRSRLVETVIKIPFVWLKYTSHNNREKETKIFVSKHNTIKLVKPAIHVSTSWVCRS